MSILLGRQRTCDGCGKTVFKTYTGDESIYSINMNYITDDCFFDSSVDNDWVYVDYLGDLCPECVEKVRKMLPNFENKNKYYAEIDEIHSE